MPENKPQDPIETDDAQNSEALTETDAQLVSGGTASDDPIDPMDEPGPSVPPRPPGSES